MRNITKAIKEQMRIIFISPRRRAVVAAIKEIDETMLKNKESIIESIELLRAYRN